METVFLICAVLGGTLLVCQFLAGLLGIGGDHDVGHDGGDAGHFHDGHGHEQPHPGSWFISLLSFKTITAALTFFGLTGKIALAYEANEPAALGLATGAGFAALYLVAMLMRSLAKLKSDGTVRMDRAVGRTGTVYLRVPGSKTGPGKVHLMLQNRTVEYQAVTSGSELPTGTPVKVVGVVNSDTVEVVAA